MSTTNLPQPESPSPVPEELVAYLDGELPPDECRLVEQRLAVDADYRQQLRELDQAWEAIDSLPSTAVDDDFARTTIEMVSLAAQHDQNEHLAAATSARRHRLWLWAGAGVAAAVLGFVVAGQVWRSTENALLGDLPIIQQVNLLTQISNVEFLRRLRETVPVDQLVADETTVQREVEQIRAVSAETIEKREQWLKSLPPEEKADLAARAYAFEKLSNLEHDRVRELERQIREDADVDQLRETMTAYGQWLARRTEGEQEELRNLATTERIEGIRDIVRRENRFAARRLDPDEAESLRNEIRKIADENRVDFLRELELSGGDPARLRRGDGPPQEAVAMMIVTRQLRNDKTEEQTQKRLVAQLNPASRKYWESIGSSRRDRRNWQLVRWMYQAMRPRREPGDLERFFSSDELSNEDRERLLNMPRGEMETELERLYFTSQPGLPREWLGGWDWLRPRRRAPGNVGPPDGRPLGPPPDDRPGRERFDVDRRGPHEKTSLERDDRRGDRLRPERPPPPQDGLRRPPPNGAAEPI